jgi:hypothetical protein
MESIQDGARPGAGRKSNQVKADEARATEIAKEIHGRADGTKNLRNKAGFWFDLKNEAMKFIDMYQATGGPMRRTSAGTGKTIFASCIPNHQMANAQDGQI